MRIPRGIGLHGKVKIRKSRYTGDIFLTESKGKVHVKGNYNTANDAYNLLAKADNLQLRHFLPNMDVHPFTGIIAANGHGMDFFNPKSAVNLTAKIDKFQYGQYKLDGIGGKITMKNGITNAHIQSSNKMIAGNFKYHGKFTDKMVDGHLKGMIQRLDFRRLGVMRDPYVLTTWADVDLKSNLKDRHFIKGPLRHLVLNNEGRKHTTQLVKGDFDVVATVRGTNLDSHLKGHLAQANLKALGMVDKPYVVATDADIDFRSNMNNYYHVKGYVGDMRLNEIRGKDDVPLVAGSFDVNAIMNGNDIKGSLKGLFPRADLYQLGIVDQPFNTNFSADIDFAMKRKDDLMAKGLIGNVQVQTRDTIYSSGDVTLNVLSQRDSTHAVIKGGDFLLNTELNGSYKQVMNIGQGIYSDLQRQIASKYIDQPHCADSCPRDTSRCILVQTTSLASYSLSKAISSLRPTSI